MVESLEQAQIKKSLDTEYENKTGEGYQKAKEDKLGFYGEFQKEETQKGDFSFDDFSNGKRKFIKVGENDISNNNIKNKDNHTQEDFLDREVGEKGKSEIFKENSKYLPILDRLVETEQLSVEARNIVLGADLDKVDFNSIENLDQKDKELLEGVFFNIESGQNNKKKNLEDFRGDIKNIEKTPELENFDFSIEKENFSSEVLNKVGQNYLKFPEKDGKFDEVKDMSVAINTTKVQILKEVKNIPIDTETYKVAIKNIESNDIKKQLEGIDSLYTLAYSKEGELGKTTLDKYKNKRKKVLIKEYTKLDKEFEQLNIQKTTEEINKRKKEINQRIIEIGNEANEIEAGDIFPANDQEKINSNIEEVKQ